MALKIGFIGGALAGVAAGMMLAPKAGRVTRRWVRIKGGRYAKETRAKLAQRELPIIGKIPLGGGADRPEGYCFKCGTKRNMVNATELPMSDGRLSLRGECAVCGGGMSRMVKS